jgi:hypothetical protein
VVLSWLNLMLMVEFDASLDLCVLFILIIRIYIFFLLFFSWSQGSSFKLPSTLAAIAILQVFENAHFDSCQVDFSKPFLVMKSCSKSTLGMTALHIVI